MPGEKPLLWKAFDAAERAVAPRLEAATRSPAFAEALGQATRVRKELREGLERRSRLVWHLVNLPAGSDISRLRRQVAQLDRELRRVSEQLDRALAEPAPSEEEDDAHRPGNERAARARRPAGPRPAGRRAQRAPRA